MSDQTINVMTPVWRTENLRAILDSILYPDSVVERHRQKIGYVNVIWWLVYDGIEDRFLGWTPHAYMIAKTNGDDFAGHKKRNAFLDHCKNGYVYFCDDDNLIHPELFKNLVGKLDGTSIIMDQYNKNDTLRLSHKNAIEVGQVDVGNVLINRRDIGDLRFEADKYEADGILLNEIFVKRGVPIKRDAEAKTYYNKLR